VRVLCRAVDCTRPDQVTHFVDRVVDELGGLHILVNNAGMARDGALWRMSDDDWRRVLETNLSGAFYFTPGRGLHLPPAGTRKDRQRVVGPCPSERVRTGQLCGLQGRSPGPHPECRPGTGPSNVNVNAVAPGYIRTTRLTDGVPSEILDEARERSALRRLGDPQDVAGAVLFLCSEAARHMTGITLPVDGGYLL
jgi:3-oxoacyl-[acyl-carrier protein] reductase